jgi:hypothetical protein
MEHSYDELTKMFIVWYMADGSTLEQTIYAGEVVQEHQIAKPKAYVQHLGDVVQQVVQSIAQEEPKYGSHKHGWHDEEKKLYWNAHCQFWQKQCPPALGWNCEKMFGKGPFVHGYHAPMPYGGSVGTGIGYWHADKQKWLLWEPDPLPEASKAVVTKTTYVPKEIHHDGEKWVEVPVKLESKKMPKKTKKPTKSDKLFADVAKDLAFKHKQEE